MSMPNSKGDQVTAVSEFELSSWQQADKCDYLYPERTPQSTKHDRVASVGPSFVRYGYGPLDSLVLTTSVRNSHLAYH